MSSSTLKPKFLLDENVRIELAKYLISQGFDVRISPKATTDLKLTSISLKEKRILVTNDKDFSEYPKDKVFSVVWLRIPQNDPKSLTSAFPKLLKEFDNFAGKLVVLGINKWKDYYLPVSVDTL